MAYCTVDDILKRVSEAGAAKYIDNDGDGVLNSEEQGLVTEAIAYADAIIDGRLAKAALVVDTTQTLTIVKRISIGLATLEAFSRRGQQPAWAFADAKAQHDLLEMLVTGGLKSVEVTKSFTQEPVVSNPRVVPGEGVCWPKDKQSPRYP